MILLIRDWLKVSRYILTGVFYSCGIVLGGVASAGTPTTPDEVPWIDCRGKIVTSLPSDSVRIAGVGDLVFADDAQLNQQYFRAFTPVFQANHFVLGNLEGAITTSKDARKKYIPGRSYAFRFPPDTARLLKDSGFHALSLANNHVKDYGEEGLADSVKYLQAQGLITSGLQQGEFELVTVQGRRLALISFGFYSHQNDMNDIPSAVQLVQRARGSADLVIISLHAGAEGENAVLLPKGKELFLGESRGDSRLFAKAVIEAGADAIIGYGPHLVRAAECLKGKPVYYSVGNFVSAGGLNTQGLPGISAVVELVFNTQQQFVAARVLPVVFTPQRYPDWDPKGRGVLLINYLGQRAKQQWEDFTPLIHPGFEDEVSAFDIQLRKTPSLR